MQPAGNSAWKAARHSDQHPVTLILRFKGSLFTVHYCYGRRLPAGGGSFAPMREEEVGPASCAIVSDMEVGSLDACMHKLGAGHGGQVEPRRGGMLGSMAGRVDAPRESLTCGAGMLRKGLKEIVRVCNPAVERIHHFLADVVTARPDAGTHSGNQVPRL